MGAGHPGVPGLGSLGSDCRKSGTAARDCLLAEFRADLDEDFFNKIVSGRDDGRSGESSTGCRAFWLAGAPHVFMFETGGLTCRRRDTADRKCADLGDERDHLSARVESGLGGEAADRRVAELIGFSADHSGSGSADPSPAGCRAKPDRLESDPARGCSSMAELQPSKLVMRVRFPSPAPRGVVGGGCVSGGFLRPRIESPPTRTELRAQPLSHRVTQPLGLTSAPVAQRTEQEISKPLSLWRFGVEGAF